ncbi:hypothetical protein [Flavobacterium flavigenum]|uniref:hypothetical protein n=1 Tax=Flavobacterium flavigenum TaxID=3003258 RepID=UPI002482E229|nr:hypothetical protein [Flavobacterium flavigenum]
MFEMKIEFPSKITSEVTGYEKLIEFYEKMSTIYNSEITIDFRNNFWLEANLCAIFGAMIEELENRGNIIKLDNIKQPKDILARNGFLLKYGVNKPASTYNTELEYKTFSRKQGKSFSFYIDNEILKKEGFPKLSKLLSKKINESIFELYENARTHGACKNIHTCGQYFPTKKLLDITIVDMGQTIKYNVNNFNKSNWSGSDCIEWATKDKNTTKTGNISGGLGLAIIFDFIKLNGGKIQIISSDGYWELRRGKIYKQELNFSFPGTIANLEFNLSDTNEYILKEEIDLDNIF